jgi:hypothetical protein
MGGNLDAGARPAATIPRMTADELRQRFTWMAKLEDDADVVAIPLAEPGTTLTDGDNYVDATSPKRGRVLAMEGERVPAGGVYVVKSATDPGLWDRIGAAIR